MLLLDENAAGNPDRAPAEVRMGAAVLLRLLEQGGAFGRKRGHLPDVAEHLVVAVSKAVDRGLMGGDVRLGVVDRHESLDLEPQDTGLPIGSDVECSHVAMIAHAIWFAVYICSVVHHSQR